MAFFETEFPRFLDYGITGGAGFSTVVNQGFSGFEQRNRNWNKARWKWTCSVKAQQNGDPTKLTDFDLLRNFHLNVGGMADAFRLFDPTDYSASMASGTGILTPGDGFTTDFQLTKTYTSNDRSYVRKITKPITATVKDYQGNDLEDTVVMYVNGTPQMLGVDYTVDATTGIVSFAVAPDVDAIVAADFEFHYPARFNSDEFKATVEESDVAGGHALVTVAAIELIEVRV